MQAVILLSQPGRDFDGGELVLAEQRPRMQSRALVAPLCLGDAAIFAVSHRPVQGSRGPYRVNMRHGVSRIRRGTRNTSSTARPEDAALKDLLIQRRDEGIFAPVRLG